jgi:VanZ family protein
MGKKLLLFFWMGAIFLMTSVSMPRGHVTQTHNLSIFKWESEPNLSEFITPVPTLTEEFLIRKFGHILVFFLLAVLFILAYHSIWNALLACFLFGLSTEFIQLFFSRGGRLFDVWIDGIGVILGVIFSFCMTQILDIVKNERDSLKG